MARIRVLVSIEAGEPPNRCESEIETVGTTADLQGCANKAVRQVTAATRAQDSDKPEPGEPNWDEIITVAARRGDLAAVTQVVGYSNNVSDEAKAGCAAINAAVYRDSDLSIKVT